jgi:uroporphyrinogen III methyltransferase/synthase
VVETYETVIPAASKKKLQALLKNPACRPHVITFTSSSTAQNFVELLGLRGPKAKLSTLRDIQFASIGPVTSATLRRLGLPVSIEAREYTMPGLVKAIVTSRG